MLGLLVLALTICNMESAPVGPNYDNIQYLHNFTLTYANNSLDGLGAIDNFTDVNSQMAQNLKSAINLALPGYLSSSRSSTPSSSSGSFSASSSSSTEMPSASRTFGSSGSSTSTVMPMASTQMPGRKRRAAASSSSPSSTPSSVTPANAAPVGSFPSSTTPSSGQPSTTQPYGTDEEFYARTDLVHFHVDINDLEGSGTI